MCAKKNAVSTFFPELTTKDCEAEEYLKYLVANIWESLLYTFKGKAVKDAKGENRVLCDSSGKAFGWSKT
jgi:hypothetical protein